MQGGFSSESPPFLFFVQSSHVAATPGDALGSILFSVGPPPPPPEHLGPVPWLPCLLQADAPGIPHPAPDAFLKST